jgi:hypothetical protein
MAGKVAAGVGLAVVMAGGHAKDATGDAAPPSRAVAHHAAKTHHAKPTAVPTRPAPLPAVAGQPLVAFTSNGGQVDGTVRYLAEGAGYHLYLTDQEAVLAVHTPKGTTPVRVGVLELQPVGAAAGREVTTRDRRHVVTPQVWPGIDWAWHGSQDAASFDLYLASGVDARAACFALVGVRSLQLDRQGNLLIATPRGVLTLPAPTAWQGAPNGTRRAVSVQYVLLGSNRFGFRVGAHDPSRPVTVDSSMAG